MIICRRVQKFRQDHTDMRAEFDRLRKAATSEVGFCFSVELLLCRPF
jgi:hypothetical protein